MPEGDAIRRAAARLDDALAGRVLVRAELRWPDAAGAELTGCTVLGTAPYGKHLLTRLDDGRTLHTHLRMDGSWVTERGPARWADRDPWVRALLAGPDRTAVGIRLGMLDLMRTVDEHTVVGHLGPDVLTEEFASRDLAGVLDAYRTDPRPVAEVLLDQRVQAGFGTMWMAEALFARRLWPWTPAAELTDAGTVVMTARELMSRAISGRQATRVHARRGLPCERCGTAIAEGTARRPPMQRPVFWCPRCQAAPHA